LQHTTARGQPGEQEYKNEDSGTGND